MHQFGVTRSVRRQDHAVFTPDTFVRAALPGMRKAVAIVHAAPAIGAAFTQYTAEVEAGGCLGELPTSCERFIYVIEGKVTSISRDNRTLLARTITHTLLSSSNIPSLPLMKANLRSSRNATYPSTVCVRRPLSPAEHRPFPPSRWKGMSRLLSGICCRITWHSTVQ